MYKIITFSVLYWPWIFEKQVGERGGGLDWIGLAVDGDSWRAVGNALTNLRVS